jgi:hypothetical protein
MFVMYRIFTSGNVITFEVVFPKERPDMLRLTYLCDKYKSFLPLLNNKSYLPLLNLQILKRIPIDATINTAVPANIMAFTIPTKIIIVIVKYQPDSTTARGWSFPFFVYINFNFLIKVRIFILSLSIAFS